MTRSFAMRTLFIAIFCFAPFGQMSLAEDTTASVLDLLPFASSKYNRSFIHEQNQQYGRRFGEYVFRENTRLKDAIETLDKAQSETEKQEQWIIIVGEFYNNTLLPDVVTILECLPEEEQIRFVAACRSHGRIMDESGHIIDGVVPVFGSVRLTRELKGSGVAKRMQFDLLKKLLLRGDFRITEKFTYSPYRPALSPASESFVYVPVTVFRENPEIKTMNDYYRVLEEYWDKIGFRFRGFENSNTPRFYLSDSWVAREKWACIAIEQALFQDFDLAVESAQKIQDDEHRLFIQLSVAKIMASYGKMSKAIEMWENFPPEMFVDDFIKKLDHFVEPFKERSYPLRFTRAYVFTILLSSQMQGGITAEAIPAETILPVIQGDRLFAPVAFKYFYANRHIQELGNLIEQYDFFHDEGYPAGPESHPVTILCKFSRTSLLMGEKDESQQLLAKAFELYRKFDEKSRNLDESNNTYFKLQLMKAIADTRYQFEMYDYPDAFTREELAFSNPKDGTPMPDRLPSFMYDEEEKVMREREIAVAAGQFQYSQDPFFAAAARASLKNDHFMALISTGKGLAKVGEKELSVEYYRHAVTMAEQTPRSDYIAIHGIISVYSQIAQNLISTVTDSPLLDEVLELMNQAKTGDKGWQYDSAMREIEQRRLELQEQEQRENSPAPPRPSRRAQEVQALPKPETEFDFYAHEFHELEGWRHPLGLLLKKMPTPAEARHAVQLALNGKPETAETYPYRAANRTVLLKKDEPINDAIRRVSALPKDGNQDRAAINADINMQALAQACIRHGRLDDAILVSGRIVNDVPKADVLLAVAFRRYDLVDDTRKVTDAKRFFDPFEQHQLRYGNTDDEKKRMDIYFRDERYCAYVIRLAQRGLMDRAEACLDKIRLPFERAEAIYTIAMKYALTGEFEKALRVAQTMKDAGTGSYTSWEVMHADGIGPHYSKLQTMTMILGMAESGEYAGSSGSRDFQPLAFVDELDEKIDAKVHLLLAIVSHRYTTNLVIGRSFLGIPFHESYDISGTEEKPRTQDAEEAKNLLRRALTLTIEIDNPKLRETVFLEMLPFLVDAKMADESYQATVLINTSGSFATEQKESEYSYSTAIPSQIAAVIDLLTTQQYEKEALELCQKVIDWVKPLGYDGEQGGFWTNRPNDIRNEILCRYAELQAEAGAVDQARQTLAGERTTVDSQAKKGTYLQRIAEALAKIGDQTSAKETYIDAISTVLGTWSDRVWITEYDQLQYFDKIIESYCRFVSN